MKVVYRSMGGSSCITERPILAWGEDSQKLHPWNCPKLGNSSMEEYPLSNPALLIL